MVNSTWLADTIAPTTNFVSFSFQVVQKARLVHAGGDVATWYGFSLSGGGDRAGVIMNASRLRQSGFVVPAPLRVPTRLWPEGASLPNSATATRHQGQIAGGSLYVRHRTCKHVVCSTRGGGHPLDDRMCASWPGANRPSGHAWPARHVIDNFSCTNLPPCP